jgi:fluoroquinolone transport system permease protein
MNGLRARQAWLLVRPSLLGDGFAGALAAAVAAVGIALCAAMLTEPAAAIARWPGWAAGALAAGMAGLLRDPARHATAASPTPLPLRRGVGLAAGLPIVVAAWIAVLALATTGVGTPYGPASRLGLTLQAAALITVTLAAGAALVRKGLGERATRAAMLVPLAVTSAAVMLPDSVALLALPTTPAWNPALDRWAVLLVASALVLAATSRRD